MEMLEETRKEKIILTLFSKIDLVNLIEKILRNSQIADFKGLKDHSLIPVWRIIIQIYSE